jgi:hypothetical protein
VCLFFAHWSHSLSVANVPKPAFGYTKTMPNLNDIFTPSTLDTAYLWLCKQRRNFPANADIWHLRFHWHRVRQDLLQSLNKQDYTFQPLSVLTKADSESIHLWSSQAL